jgi:mitochondrial cardiolipin hydrolase
MDKLLAYLQKSIEDEVFSKEERRMVKTLMQQGDLSADELNLLRNRIFELASGKINSTNYSFILEWIKDSTSLLITPSTTTQVHFSPGDACRNSIIHHIDRAIYKLQICVFTISDDSITKSILAAHRRSVLVNVISDNDKSLDRGSDIDQLAQAGIAVKLDVTTNHMHHKFMIADHKTLITGSYNWTLSAAKYNHENILVTNEINVVKLFDIEFEKLWNEMKLIN